MALTIENHVYREGEGIPLILVHGFPVDHRMWDRCATALMEMSDAQECTQYPIWAPDMPGAGASQCPDRRTVVRAPRMGRFPTRST